MARTSGQQLGYDQLLAIASVSDGTLELGAASDPNDRDRYLRVQVSFDCSAIRERSDDGIHLRGRERFSVAIPPDFPYKHPSVSSSHRRWAGTPHVQWGRWLCLYQASSDWAPQAGMYGFVERVDQWLRHAVVGHLDPADAPLHPPVQYGTSGTLITVNANCPSVGDTAWIGFGDLRVRGPHRLDLTGWSELPQTTPSALTILLPEPLAWEYPTRVDALFAMAVEQGIELPRLQVLLMLSAHASADGEPMYVVVGSPMRRGHANEQLQHIAVWQIASDMADAFRTSLPRPEDSSRLDELRDEYRQVVFDWAAASKISWCSVTENRPEIVVRRDEASPSHHAFAGKHVVIWGCGAIGGHAAEWIARAGASRITLYDKDIVTPGVLVRQPYTDADIGQPKATQLAARLRQIRPELRIDKHVCDIFDRALPRARWHDDADVLIDATASAAIRLKLEHVNRAYPSQTTTVVSMLFGHDVERGLAAVVPPAYPGASEDALRQAKIACNVLPGLHEFADEFWPSKPRTDHFQPEPGCSDPTFRGATVEVAAICAGLLNLVALEIVADKSLSASAHFLALPGVAHRGRREASITIDPPTVLTDGLGRYEIRLTPHALSEIRAWTARNDRANRHQDETGGVLVGRRDETTDIVWIDAAGGPPPDSDASPLRFTCGTSGVPSFLEEHAQRSSGESTYLGMWHTHPSMPSTPSAVDVVGMVGLVASQEAREAVMLIVGGSHRTERLGAYVFNGDAIKRDGEVKLEITPQAATPTERPGAPIRDIGLALSGGGSRAVAFHLGCLRALHDRGVLPRIRVVSGVSGGGLMTGLYAYGPNNFAEFDERVTELLRRGMQWRIARRALFSHRLPQSVGTRAIAGSAAVGTAAAMKMLRRKSSGAPLRRWVSRTDAFEDVLRGVLSGVRLDEPRQDDGLDVVINACDLRTGGAFRFGSQESGSSHLRARLVEAPDLATAVATSAAYPLLLPALDRNWEFERHDGSRFERRVVLTDGGVFDNSGTSAFRPGRSAKHSYNVYSVDYVIACDAGRGLLSERVPFHVASRTARAFEASFRKLQDASRGQLHDDRAAGKLNGFVMPYVGQIDENLPWSPPDLVLRADVVDYPTDFKAMSQADLDLIARRGEQLTRLLVERWCPDL